MDFLPNRRNPPNEKSDQLDVPASDSLCDAVDASGRSGLSNNIRPLPDLLKKVYDCAGKRAELARG